MTSHMLPSVQIHVFTSLSRPRACHRHVCLPLDHLLIYKQAHVDTNITSFFLHRTPLTCSAFQIFSLVGTITHRRHHQCPNTSGMQRLMLHPSGITWFLSPFAHCLIPLVIVRHLRRICRMYLGVQRTLWHPVLAHITHTHTHTHTNYFATASGYAHLAEPGCLCTKQALWAVQAKLLELG